MILKGCVRHKSASSRLQLSQLKFKRCIQDVMIRMLPFSTEPQRRKISCKPTNFKIQGCFCDVLALD